MSVTVEDSGAHQRLDTLHTCNTEYHTDPQLHQCFLERGLREDRGQYEQTLTVIRLSRQCSSHMTFNSNVGIRTSHVTMTVTVKDSGVKSIFYTCNTDETESPATASASLALPLPPPPAKSSGNGPHSRSAI